LTYQSGTNDNLELSHPGVFSSTYLPIPSTTGFSGCSVAQLIRALHRDHKAAGLVSVVYQKMFLFIEFAYQTNSWQSEACQHRRGIDFNQRCLQKLVLQFI
jgi:hypothetical protein